MTSAPHHVHEFASAPQEQHDDINGNCTHCGAMNGEVCRDPNPGQDRNVLMFVPKFRAVWPRAGTFGGDGGSAA